MHPLSLAPNEATTAVDEDGPDRPEPGKLLVVDDDALLRLMMSRTLAGAGHDVETAPDGGSALRLLETRRFDAVVADVQMPGVDGLTLLRTLRERGHAVPVLLMTASPGLPSATGAVACGAQGYLVKPVPPAVLGDAVAQAIALGRAARAQVEPPAAGDGRCEAGPLHARFARGLESAWIAFQPIVRMSDRAVFAYEALVRTREPGLTMPLQLFEAAERLGRMHDLGRAIRRRVAAESARCPEGALLFVNLHAVDLQDPELYDRRSPLASIARRVVLELTERHSLEPLEEARACASRLRALGFRIAIDDLGAGYSGLSSCALLEPEVIKIDMSLARGVQHAPRQQILVQSIARLAGDLHALVVAEGVETIEERDALRGLGCDLMQGYLFARPAAGFAVPVFRDAVETGRGG